MTAFAAAAERFSELWVVIGRTARGEIPVGTIAARIDQNRLWPRADWFPWASTRNRLEGILRFVVGTGPARTIFYSATMGEKEFLNHVCRYGIAQRIGTGQRWFPDGEPGALFQSRQL